MPRSKGRRAPARRPPRPRNRPKWLIDEAIETTAIAVNAYHPSLAEHARIMIARTAVNAAVACLPRLQEMDGPAPLEHEQTDPREPGGGLDVITEGESGVLVDPARAVLVETVQAVLIDAHSVVLSAEMLTRSVGLLLGGQINGTEERASILYVMPLEGAADLVVEVLALAMRSGPLINVQLSQLINAKLQPYITEETPA